MYQQMPPYQPPYQPPQPPYPPYEPPYGYQAHQTPRKGGLRAWAVVLIALGAFLIGIYTGTAIASLNKAIPAAVKRPPPMG